EGIDGAASIRCSGLKGAGCSRKVRNRSLSGHIGIALCIEDHVVRYSGTYQGGIEQSAASSVELANKDTAAAGSERSSGGRKVSWLCISGYVGISSLINGYCARAL